MIRNRALSHAMKQIAANSAGSQKAGDRDDPGWPVRVDPAPEPMARKTFSQTPGRKVWWGPPASTTGATIRSALMKWSAFWS